MLLKFCVVAQFDFNLACRGEEVAGRTIDRTVEGSSPNNKHTVQFSDCMFAGGMGIGKVTAHEKEVSSAEPSLIVVRKSIRT